MSKAHQEQRWTPEQAKRWAAGKPWLVGCNYTPRHAINQLEMWQRDTFDPKTIDEELGWASSLGFNSMRVFLHDLMWKHDRKGFLARVDQFLQIANGHGIGAMLVFFDSCWHPSPMIGKQPDPEPGVHNSGWVQSPGVAILRDREQFDQLEDYVTGVVKYFRDDDRVHVWDIWNEPDNNNWASRGPRDIADKGAIVANLLPSVFRWARTGNPTQPLTSGPWLGDWSCSHTLKAWERAQFDHSDVISFHCYGPPDEMAERIAQLQRYERPLFCTEYMSRSTGSTFQAILPVLKRHRVHCYNWGFVQGKTQTHIPWDSWQKPYIDREPEPWFHEVLRGNGKPYRNDEAETIRTLTARE
jgi:hypothetical protein